MENSSVAELAEYVNDRAAVVNQGRRFDCYKVMPRAVGGDKKHGRLVAIAVR